MRIYLKEKNHFLAVFETFFNQPIERPIDGISIDSRNIKKNDLFIAIKGRNFDGNDFVDQALKNGASYTLSPYKNESRYHLLVENLHIFIKELSRSWLQRFDGKIVGITGSNGKTTTKDLIAHILKSKFKVEKTLGNYNTSISVPLSILSFLKYCVGHISARLSPFDLRFCIHLDTTEIKNFPGPGLHRA